jgi:prepilin-type N-terminal cleavage/methylation domain-containing protein
MINSVDNNKGFSLIEFMIAITILSVGLMALVGLQSTAIKGNGSNKNLTTAVMLAEKKMEDLKNTAFTSLTTGTTNDPGNPLTGIGGSGGFFNRSWNVQTYSSSTNMKQITVTIAWTAAGRSHSTSLDTVVTQ